MNNRWTFPSLNYRMLIYFILSILDTIYITYSAIHQSKLDLEYDKSAMAWVVFLPYLIPLFWTFAVFEIGIGAAIFEFVLFLWRKWKT